MYRIVLGIAFMVKGSGYRVSGLAYRVSSIGYRVLGMGYEVSGIGYRVSDIGLRIGRDRELFMRSWSHLSTAQGGGVDWGVVNLKGPDN